MIHRITTSAALIVIVCTLCWDAEDTISAEGRDSRNGIPRKARAGTLDTLDAGSGLRDTRHAHDASADSAEARNGSPGTMVSRITPPDEASLEVRLFRFLNRSLANPVCDAVMPVLTDFRRSRIVLLVVWSLLVLFGGARGRWAALILIPLVAASDQISSTVIKPLIGRMRPCEVLGNVHLWYGPEGWIDTPARVIRSYKSSFSFPSGHATNITASMLFLGLAYRRVIVPLIVIASAVSYSRVYIGVHWPSDVLVGMVIGGLLAWPAYLLHRRLSGGNARRSTPDTPPSG